MYDGSLIIYHLTGATRAFTNGHYGSTSLSFATSYIYCRGTEPQIANCSGMYPTPNRPSRYCRSSDAAGVECYGKVMRG